LTAEPLDEGGTIALRLHSCFLSASEAVLAEVARFAAKRLRREARTRALSVIRAHFDAKAPQDPVRRRSTNETLGRVYNLETIKAELNRAYFDARLDDVAITWGRRTRRSRRRRQARSHTLELGSYVHDDRLIRIHRVLDHPRVPRYVLAAVVYHELLHAALPAQLQGGRRRIHTPEFRRRERLFSDLERAEAWIDRHLF
jgi:predicted metal-dependent hydrolase